MAVLIGFITSGIGLVVAFIGVMLLHGSWEAIAAGVGVLALVPLLLSIAVLYTEGERLSSPR